MIVRPLKSVWRFARNELSGKPGAVHGILASIVFVLLLLPLALRDAPRVKVAST
jgi:hypothetical protein